MASAEFRRTHPEYVARQKKIEKNRYDNNPEYREMTKKRALERYYRLKALKQQTDDD